MLTNAATIVNVHGGKRNAQLSASLPVEGEEHLVLYIGLVSRTWEKDISVGEVP